MTPHVMFFDVSYIDGFFDSGLVVDIRQPTMNVRIIKDSFLITLEMLDVNCIKSDDCNKKSDISCSNFCL